MSKAQEAIVSSQKQYLGMSEAQGGSLLAPICCSLILGTGSTDA